MKWRELSLGEKLIVGGIVAGALAFRMWNIDRLDKHYEAKYRIGELPYTEQHRDHRHRVVFENVDLKDSELVRRLASSVYVGLNCEVTVKNEEYKYRIERLEGTN